jgi:hypothetical protein
MIFSACGSLVTLEIAPKSIPSTNRDGSLEESESAVSFEIGIDDPVSNGTEKGSESFSVRGVSRRDSLAKYAAAFF